MIQALSQSLKIGKGTLILKTLKPKLKIFPMEISRSMSFLALYKKRVLLHKIVLKILGVHDFTCSQQPLEFCSFLDH